MWKAMGRPAHYTKWICSCFFLGWKSLVFSLTYRRRNNCVPYDCLRSLVKTWGGRVPQLLVLHEQQPLARSHPSYPKERPSLQVCNHRECGCDSLWRLCAFLWSEVVCVLMYECVCVYTLALICSREWGCGPVAMGLLYQCVCMRVYKTEYECTSLSPGELLWARTPYPKSWSIFWSSSGSLELVCSLSHLKFFFFLRAKIWRSCQCCLSKESHSVYSDTCLHFLELHLGTLPSFSIGTSVMVD